MLDDNIKSTFLITNFFVFYQYGKVSVNTSNLFKLCELIFLKTLGLKN